MNLTFFEGYLIEVFQNILLLAYGELRMDSQFVRQISGIPLDQNRQVTVIKTYNCVANGKSRVCRVMDMNETDFPTMFSNFSPEAALLLCVVREEVIGDTCSGIESLLEKTINWDFFINLALHNEVITFVYPTFSCLPKKLVPVKALDFFAHIYHCNLQRNETLCKELVTLNRIFTENGVGVINYKGPETVHRAGGKFQNRQFNDLDFLIKEEQLPVINKLVAEQGYQNSNGGNLAKWRKDHTYSKKYSQDGKPAIRALPQDIEEFVDIIIEPHLFLTEHTLPLSIDYARLWRRVESHEFYGEGIPSFGPNNLLFILCVNGCKAKWKNLKLVCNIGAMLNGAPELDIDKCAAIARQAGGERMLMLGLLLASDMLGISRFPGYVDKARNDATLYRVACKIVAERSRTKHARTWLKSFNKKFSSVIWSTLETPGMRLTYLWRTVTTEHDLHRKRMPLPGFLHFLYIVLVPLHDYFLIQIRPVFKRLLTGAGDDRTIKNRKYQQFRCE